VAGLIFALIFAVSAPSFVVGDLKEYGDWVVGCDNNRNCHAASLPVETGPHEPVGDGKLTIAVKRSGNPHGPVSVSFAAAGAGPVDEMQAVDVQMRATRWIAVDGSKLDIRLKSDTSIYKLDAEASTKLIALIRGKSTLSLLDQRGKPIATVSLGGLAKVLEYMDERQYLTGTTAALGRPGKKKVDIFTVPPMVPYRRINVSPKPDLPPVTLGDAQLAKLRLLDPCLPYGSGEAKEAPSYHRLDRLNTLMILTTSCGGYNPYRLLYILEDEGTAQPALFWPYPGNAMNEEPDLPDASWDDTTRVLTTFGRGRVLADCGESKKYAWHEGRFRLVHDERMYPCRGSTDYITTYNLKVFIDESVKPVRADRKPEKLNPQ
jgi:Protein of unknown function (DUF1176)